ncbi:hypothetical protein [Qipengyuania sp. 902]|uniref:hypothetical protein n=1 Tax=Qipengyuania sp. 902 TaxID=3417565 RepID=UPI003EB96402
MSSRNFDQALRLVAADIQEAGRKLQALSAEPRFAGRKVYDLHTIKLHASALALIARREHHARRVREELIPSAHFGEPAWDLLLDLFANSVVGKDIPKNAAQIAAHCPPTTALRYIEQLENEGMISERKSEEDGRVLLMRLTDEALVSVGSYLLNISGLAEDDEMPVKD